MSEFINWLEKRDEKYLNEFFEISNEKFHLNEKLLIEASFVGILPKGFTSYTIGSKDNLHAISNDMWGVEATKGYTEIAQNYDFIFDEKYFTFTTNEINYIFKHKSIFAKLGGGAIMSELENMTEIDQLKEYLNNMASEAYKYYNTWVSAFRAFGLRGGQTQPRKMKQMQLLKNWDWAGPFNQPGYFSFGAKVWGYAFLIKPKIGPHRDSNFSEIADDLPKDDPYPDPNAKPAALTQRQQPVGGPGAAPPAGGPGAAAPAGRPGAAPPAGRPGAAPPVGRPDVVDDPFSPRFMPDPDLPKKVADEIERRRLEAQKKAGARRPPIGAGVPNAGGIPLDPRTGKPQTGGGYGGVSLLPTEPRKQKTPEEIAKEQNSYLLKNHQNEQIRKLATELEGIGHEVYHRPGTLGIVITDPNNKNKFYYFKEKNEKSLLDALKQVYKEISGFDPD